MIKVHTFENFIQYPEVSKMLKAFHDLAYGDTESFMLLVYGFTGTGKTHLMKALVNTYKLRGDRIGYIDWARLVDALMSAMRDTEIVGKYDFMLHNYLTMPALAIDDYGMGTTNTAWQQAIFERIIVERYERRLITAVVSNIDLSEMSDRVIRRFKDKESSVVVATQAKPYQDRLNVANTKAR